MTRRRARTIGGAMAAAAAIALSTVAVGVLESTLDLPNASSVYLVAVVAVAVVSGTRGAAVTAVAAVLVYDWFFTIPRHTLAVADAREWLDLVLLLFVAAAVGQLAALQRRRTRAAAARERELRSMFEVTRLLARRGTTRDVLPAIAAALARDAGLSSASFALGAGDAEPFGAYAVLQRRGETAMPTLVWRQVRPRGAARPFRTADRRLRIRLETTSGSTGSMWATRPRDAGDPDEAATRLLAVAADLVAEALAHDAAAEQAREVEVARRSDRLKSALLESVSHDLRTPLASIRASAGTLMDPEVWLAPDERRAAAVSIDREAQRLNRLVANLLDLTRIEAGALQSRPEALDVEDVASRVIAGVAGRDEGRAIEVDVDDSLVVVADPVLLEEALVNVLDNAIRHTPATASIRVSATSDEGRVRLTVDDAGPGVVDRDLPHLFDKFFRASSIRHDRHGAAGGTGIGLAVVRGFVEAMDGRVTARRSSCGGLAIDIELPAAYPSAVPPEPLASVAS